MLSFRRAILSDALPLSLLAEFSFRHTFKNDFLVPADLDDYCVRTFAYAKVRQSLSNPNNYFLLVLEDNVVVGYAKLKVADRPIQLQKIYLHPAFTGKGIGQALLQESKRIATAAGGDRLWLTVEQKNRNAIAFYERTGWTTMDTFDFTIGSQLFHFFRMELALPTAG